MISSQARRDKDGKLSGNSSESSFDGVGLSSMLSTVDAVSKSILTEMERLKAQIEQLTADLAAQRGPDLAATGVQATGQLQAEIDDQQEQISDLMTRVDSDGTDLAIISSKYEAEVTALKADIVEAKENIAARFRETAWLTAEIERRNGELAELATTIEQKDSVIATLTAPGRIESSEFRDVGPASPKARAGGRQPDRSASWLVGYLDEMMDHISVD